MKRSTSILTTVCAILLIVSQPASAKDAAKPKSRYTGEKIEIAGRNILDILNMLGAKREEGVSDKQLTAYASHFDRSDRNKDGKHSKKEYIERGGFMTPERGEAFSVRSTAMPTAPQEKLRDRRNRDSNYAPYTSLAAGSTGQGGIPFAEAACLWKSTL